ncbi:hypothetical protein JOB18_027392 [Solea senegalensis]|uniref:Uncharacterized protein n=1 Tax=Solea senegalensis TaxID=28829 RepID=A0AAV6QQJ1_SOLSE|nr:hypothetical protein JOB18_027392 [Solea senegalensis]
MSRTHSEFTAASSPGELRFVSVIMCRLCCSQVNCAMAFSIVALVSVVIASILYSVDGARISLDCSEYDNDYYHYNRISQYNCLLYKNLIQVSGVLSILSLLQLIISAVIIGYTCYAACNCRE